MASPDVLDVTHDASTDPWPVTRPWVLRFARTPRSVAVSPLPETLFDHERQISLAIDGGMLPYLATHKPTVPDGSPTAPPPLDEGPKD